jgi:hypothetical protein
MPHPVSSSDLAPRDFFLFGFLKEKLPEDQIPDRESPQRTIMEIFGKISEETLTSVVAAWIERLKWVIKHSGEYFHKSPWNEKKMFHIDREKPRIRTF